MSTANFYPSQEKTDEEMYREAGKLLRKLGPVAKRKGFLPTVYMVVQVQKDRRRIDNITKDLYREAAKECGTTPRRVERNVRSLIKKCWEKQDHSLLNEIAEQEELDHCPTNATFIEMSAAYLRSHS